MPAIYIERKLDAGALTISMVMNNDGEYDDFQFRFECSETGAWFDADRNIRELCDICGILNEPDELLATLDDWPTVTTHDQNTVIISYEITGRRKTYHLAIPLIRRTYVDKQTSELRAEIVELRDQISDLKKRLAQNDQYAQGLITHIQELKENQSHCPPHNPPQYEPPKIALTSGVQLIFDRISNHNVLTDLAGHQWVEIITELILIENNKMKIHLVRNEQNQSLLHVTKSKWEEIRLLLERVPKSKFHNDANYIRRQGYQMLMYDLDLICEKLIRLGCRD